MTSYRFLTSIQVKRLYVNYIASSQPTQPTLLESAVSSPINNKYYDHQENLFQLVAILSAKIIKNHAFSNGNKRTALLAADTFLKINGYQLQRIPMDSDHNNEGIADAHVKVATSEWSVTDLARYYESIATPIDGVPQDVKRFHEEAEVH